METVTLTIEQLQNLIEKAKNKKFGEPEINFSKTTLEIIEQAKQLDLENKNGWICPFKVEWKQDVENQFDVFDVKITTNNNELIRSKKLSNSVLKVGIPTLNNKLIQIIEWFENF